MRLERLIGGLVIIGATAGCYILQPAAASGIEPGTRLALEVNDVGRVSLGNSVGPGVASIEGRLISSQNGEYLMAVSAVRSIGGGEQVWSGEQVRIKNEYVVRAYERRFSTGRSVALGAAVVGGVTIFVLKGNLFGIGKEGPDPPTDSAEALRVPRP